MMRNPSSLVRAFLLGTLLTGAFVACSGSSSVPTPRSPSALATTPPATSAASASPATKSALHGLVAMGATGFLAQPAATPDNGMEEIGAHPGVYVAAVVNVTWAQLEPAQGSFDDSAIASALANIAAYNAKYPATPVGAKLRVFAGPHIPAWVMTAAGGPITITGQNGSEQISAFWTSAYDVAWRGLQQHLASLYDSSTAISEVAISSCSSLTAEPFVIALDPSSLAAMRAYGFDDAVLMTCLTNAANDYAAWQKTPLDFTFNGYRLSDGPSLVADPSFTVGVMQAFRSGLGSRGVIANHGLQPPAAGSTPSPIYDELGALGPPIEFQTVSPTVDWPTTFADGLTYHPTEVEIWQTIAAGGQADLSQAQLATFASEL